MKHATAGLLMVVALAVAVLGKPGGAGAHAALRTSEPAANSFLRQPPREIILEFTEPIDARASGIEVLDGRGNRVATGTPFVAETRLRVTLPLLAPGIYTVVWANVSGVDGHALSGSFPFTVLNPDGSVPAGAIPPAEGGEAAADRLGRADGVATRWLVLLGLILAAGGAWLTVLWPEAPVQAARAFRWATTLGIAAAAAGTMLNLVLLLETYQALSWRDAMADTRVGRAWLARAALLAMMVMALGGWQRRPRIAAAAVIGGTMGSLAALTATSHAAATPGSAWAMAIDFMHGAAAVTWLGAVAGAVPAARFGQRNAPWRPLLRRFARLASAMVYVLLASGLLAALVHVDSAEKLTATRYGVVLLVKGALVLPLLGVAFYNARWGKARLIDARRGEPDRFMRTAALEVGVGLLVVAAAAVLSQTTTSRSIVIEPERLPFAMTAPAADLQVSLSIGPNQTGLNTFRVEIGDRAGGALDAELVRLVFRYQEDDTLGPSTLVLTREGPGVFTGQGPYMPLEGRWRVEVEIRRADADDARTFFDVRPAGGFAATGGPGGGRFDVPTAGLTWNQFGGLTLLLVGLGLAFARGTARAMSRRLGQVASTGTMAGFGLGVLLLFGVHAHEPPVGLPQNPVYPDADSIARGRALYEANCIACHGRTGVPPPGLDLDPYPLDLTVHVPQHPDGQIYRFIADGIPGTAMPAWKEQGLTDEEIWHLVNYLRTLSPVTR